jgi:mRNA-degrading endonuclease YafQ of YafQ-DinJ toxin-antitoxin module
MSKRFELMHDATTTQGVRGDLGSMFGEALNHRHLTCVRGSGGTQSVSQLNDKKSHSDVFSDCSSLKQHSVFERVSENAAVPVAANRMSLESAVQTFSYCISDFVECAYVFFEHSKDRVLVSSSCVDGPRYNCRPVLPRAVYVDSVTWNPMICNFGEEGHSYALFHDGQHVASIEVTRSRVVICHSSYSPAALDARLIDPATRLVFRRDHPKILEQVLNNVERDESIVYLPVSEVLLGNMLDKVPLKVMFRDHPLSCNARRVWVETKVFLRSMQALVVYGIKNHNKLEFARVGVNDTEIHDVPLELLV